LSFRAKEKRDLKGEKITFQNRWESKEDLEDRRDFSGFEAEPKGGVKGALGQNNQKGKK